MKAIGIDTVSPIESDEKNAKIVSVILDKGKRNKDDI